VIRRPRSWPAGIRPRAATLFKECACEGVFDFVLKYVIKYVIILIRSKLPFSGQRKGFSHENHRVEG
jgi:hypothetical protein